MLQLQLKLVIIFRRFEIVKHFQNQCKTEVSPCSHQLISLSPNAVMSYKSYLRVFRRWRISVACYLYPFPDFSVSLSIVLT